MCLFVFINNESYWMNIIFRFFFLLFIFPTYIRVFLQYSSTDLMMNILRFTKSMGAGRRKLKKIYILFHFIYHREVTVQCTIATLREPGTSINQIYKLCLGYR